MTAATHFALHPELTLYFDGQCSLCAAEMQRLGRWDRAGRLGFVDIAQAGFSPDILGVDMTALGSQLHSMTADGCILVGIDSMLVAYTLAGRGWMVWPLRIKPLRPFLSSLYRYIARNRYRISALLGYRPVTSCTEGVCRRDTPFL